MNPQIQAQPVAVIWNGASAAPPAQTGIESEAGVILETESGTAIEHE